MKLDELKQSWQQQNEEKSEQQLKAMTKQHIFSVFSRIKLRAVIESVAFLLVLLVFFTGLDADRNTAWVNTLFALALLVGIANNWLLYRRMTINAKGVNLVASLQNVHRQLRWQILFAVAFSLLLFVSAFAFLLLRVPLTDQKIMMVLFILPASIGIRTWFEVRQWQQHMTLVQYSLEELRGK